MKAVRTIEKTTNSPNLTLSATNPETMVAAVPAKADWKRKSTAGTRQPVSPAAAHYNAPEGSGSTNKPWK